MTIRIIEECRGVNHRTGKLSNTQSDEKIFAPIVGTVMDTDEVKNMHRFQRNDVFRRFLRKYGAEWRPMTELNPGVHFD